MEGVCLVCLRPILRIFNVLRRDFNELTEVCWWKIAGVGCVAMAERRFLLFLAFLQPWCTRSLSMSNSTSLYK
jgi:hypothetical protein